MIMTKKSHLNDQAKLKVLCDNLCDDIEKLLDHFELDYKDHGKMISMSCPIHGGDNNTALNLYVQGDHYRGNWKCRTHQCEKTFKGSIIGFVRGILSRNKYNWSKEGDDLCSFKDAVDFITKFLNKDLKDIKISKINNNKNKFTSAINHINNSITINTTNLLTRDITRKLLKIPCKYYLDRGFSASILDKYDVGVCDNPAKEMYNRAVVPIYDNDHKYVVGCSGRSLYEKCQSCGSYHAHDQSCPDDSVKYLYPKWKHSSNFKSQNSLYNFWFAKQHIQNTGVVIVVESPGNVWRLEENHIHNSVAIFGSSLSDRQKIILDSSGAMTIIILTDNDEAGRKAALQIKEKCEKTYRIFIPSISKSDVAEMTPSEIDLQIRQYIKDIL